MSIGAAIFRSLKRVACFLSASPLCIRFKCIICGGLNLLVQGADQIFESIRMQPPSLEIQAWSSSEDKVCPQSMAFLMPF